MSKKPQKLKFNVVYIDGEYIASTTIGKCEYSAIAKSRLDAVHRLKILVKELYETL